MQPGDLNLTVEVTGYQRFLFVGLPGGSVNHRLTSSLDRLGDKLENMHDVDGQPAPDALRRGRFQWLRAETSLSSLRDIAHPELLAATGLVRLEAASPEPLVRYEEGLRQLIEPLGGAVETLAGVQRPRSYTSYGMTRFAYDSALPPGPGDRFPLGVVTPLNKTDAWWAMDWMRRESFFLPRYDDCDNLVAPGHALAAGDGIPHITRRLVHAPDGYGVAETYDFVGYFEFAEEQAPVFRSVMSALRDVAQNPEWKYVREGPEWWGRRVGSAAALWDRR